MHHYYSNLIRHTDSRLMDEAIPWGSQETESFQGDRHGISLSTWHDTVRQIKLLL